MQNISELLEQYQLSGIKSVDKNGDSLLHLVMKSKRFSPEQVVEIIQNLFIKGVDLNVKNKKNVTVLRLAIAKRATEVIDCLLRCQVKLDHLTAHHLIEVESKKYEILKQNLSYASDSRMQKIENDSARFVEWIISKGLDVDAVDESYCDGPCGLMLAIEKDLQHIIPTLTKYTKDINYVKEEEYSIDDSDYNRENDLKGTVLHLFLKQMHNNREYHFSEPEKTWYSNYTDRYAAGIVQMLLDKGVSTALANGFGNTALHEAILQKENVNIIEILIEHTTNLNQKNNEGKTPFFIVIYEWLASNKKDIGYYVKVSLALLNEGANINEPNKDGLSPLGNAVERKRIRVIEFLRAHGADFSFIPEGGESLMHLLVKQGYYGMKDERADIGLFNYLLEHGCPANAKDKQILGNTPLHIAANNGNVEYVMELVERGADVNCKNNKGDTPLHYLCQYNQTATMIKVLLELGANASAMNFEHETPLHKLAFSSRSSNKAAELITLLLEYGADMNKGFSIIHWSIWQDYRLEDCDIDMVEVNGIPELNDCIEDYTSDETDVLLDHWIKLDAAKLKYRVRGYIDEDLKTLVKTRCYRERYEICLKEIEALKNEFIDNSVSLYTYLRMNPTTRCKYANKKKLEKRFQSLEFKRKFPDYASLLLAAYRDSVTRKPLLEPAKVKWLEITEIVLPDICTECIMSFLDTSDMFEFLELKW